MTPTTNHELLQEYIDAQTRVNNLYFVEILQSLQSRLIEPMEYEIGKEYEFHNNNCGDEWTSGKFLWYRVMYSNYIVNSTADHIRPLTISPDITSAISLLEATGEYVITKL